MGRLTVPREDDTTERVEVEVHRTVTVLGTDDKPAVELTNVNGEVKVSPLPRNGSRRAGIKLDDLERAVTALKG